MGCFKRGGKLSPEAKRKGFLSSFSEGGLCCVGHSFGCYLKKSKVEIIPSVIGE